jgi:hypothetical protein
MTAVPNPYGQREWRGRLLDNAQVAALMKVEHVLGYQLTITQGIGGAEASAGTHTKGRAVDLAWWDQTRKEHAMKDVGYAYWPRPELPGVWPYHGHGVLIYDKRSNDHGVSDVAFRQIASFDRGNNGLKGDGRDEYTYRPSPPAVFTIEEYRFIIAGGLEAPPVTKVTKLRDHIVEAIHELSWAIALGSKTEGRDVIDDAVQDLKDYRRKLNDRLDHMPKR